MGSNIIHVTVESDTAAYYVLHHIKNKMQEIFGGAAVLYSSSLHDEVGPEFLKNINVIPDRRDIELLKKGVPPQIVLKFERVVDMYIPESEMSSAIEFEETENDLLDCGCEEGDYVPGGRTSNCKWCGGTGRVSRHVKKLKAIMHKPDSK